MTLPNCKTIVHFRLSEIWAGFFNVYRCIFSLYTTHSCYCISWCIWTLYSIVILFHLLVFASRLACVTGLDCEIWASFALASSLSIAALFEMKFSTIFFTVVCVRVNVFIERVRLSLFECVHCTLFVLDSSFAHNISFKCTRETACVGLSCEHKCNKTHRTIWLLFV